MMSIPWAPSSYPSGTPERNSPNRAPAKLNAPFPEPSNCLLKFPVNGLHRFPNGPLWRQTPVSRAFFHTFPSKFPVNDPLHVPQQDLYGQRSFTSRANGLFIHLYLSQSPIRSPTKKNGENIWSPSTDPHVDRKLHTIGCGLVPQGHRFWHCNLYPSAMQPSVR